MSIFDTAAQREVNRKNEQFAAKNEERKKVAIATSERKLRDMEKILSRFGDVLTDKRKHSKTEFDSTLQELGYTYIYASTEYRRDYATTGSSEQVTGYSGYVNSSGSGTLHADTSTYETVEEKIDYPEHIEGEWVKVVKKGTKERARALEKQIRPNAKTFFYIKNYGSFQDGLKKNSCTALHLFTWLVVVFSLIFVFFSCIVSGSSGGLTVDGELFRLLSPELLNFIKENKIWGYVALGCAILCKIAVVFIYRINIETYEPVGDTNVERFYLTRVVLNVLFCVTLFLAVAHFFHWTQESDSSGEIIYAIAFGLENLLRIPFILFSVFCFFASFIMIFKNSRFALFCKQLEKRSCMINSGEYEKLLSAYRELTSLTCSLPISTNVSYEIFKQQIS